MKLSSLTANQVGGIILGACAAAIFISNVVPVLIGSALFITAIAVGAIAGYHLMSMKMEGQTSSAEFLQRFKGTVGLLPEGIKTIYMKCKDMYHECRRNQPNLLENKGISLIENKDD